MIKSQVSSVDFGQQLPFDEQECDNSIADRLTRVVELVPHSPAIKQSCTPGHTSNSISTPPGLLQ